MENPAIKYDEILAGVGYFYCDYYRCRMSKTACLRNQEMGKQTYREVGARFFYLGKKFVGPDRALSCGNCSQGEEILREMEG